MSVYKFYNSKGWLKNSKNFEDSDLFEDNRHYAKIYVSNCRKRINRFIPNKGDSLLDFASGPIQYKEYLEYSKNFKLRHCVDFSKTAIKEAKSKLKKKGKYYCNDFMKINFQSNKFDCIVSLHTLYHINKKQQRKVVLKLLKIAKKNAPIIIVYSNPETIIHKIRKKIKSKKSKKKLYFYCFKNSWWRQFDNLAEVKMVPWRSFSSQHQKILFPNNILGKFLLRVLFKLEDIFKNFFVRNFQYQIIVLKKK